MINALKGDIVDELRNLHLKRMSARIPDKDARGTWPQVVLFQTDSQETFVVHESLHTSHEVDSHPGDQEFLGTEDHRTSTRIRSPQSFLPYNEEKQKGPKMDTGFYST